MVDKADGQEITAYLSRDSTSATISDADTPRAVASLKMVVRVGCC